MQDETEVLVEDQDIIVNEAASVVYMPGISAVATVTSGDPLKAPTTPGQKKEAEGGHTNELIANWGQNNQLPREILNDIERSPELSSVLDWKKRALISGGLSYGYLEYNVSTRRKELVPVVDEKLDAWLRRTNIKRYIREATTEFYKLWHVFTEFNLDAQRDIAAMSCQETAYCRLGLQDAKGRVNDCFINANWESAKPEDVTTLKLPMIDPYFDAAVRLRADTRSFNYIYPTAGDASGYSYYQPAPWHSLRLSGWLKMLEQIPKFKLALLRNQFTLKYHVQIPEWWFEWKFRDWHQKPALKSTRIQAELKLFNDMMKGEEQAGKSILTVLRNDPQNHGKTYEGWKIEPIKDEMKDGRLIDDSVEACSHVFFGLGMDPTLIGQTPGKSMGAGSGSDKRVATNIYMLLSKSEQDIILEPIEFAAEYNGYKAPNGQPYTFWFEAYRIATLDEGKEISKKDANDEKQV
ncbi:hypothetical protein [Hymenobacter sp. BT190]|uniref:hypothetical protein n=1 Tax=Hymenobacter sp. BT190 TaxID=2763505 RepID=UPI001651AE8C|nr:hypothetical protein [Hymenobacter sp. BT190]MBC6698081.1 hypothetical protein [Hymenobacter sp. BT190]